MPLRLIDRLVVDQIQKVCSLYPMVKRLYLFGSQARGEATPQSDYDFYAELDQELLTWTGYYDLIRNLESALNSSIDFISGETVAQRSPVLWREIQRDKVLVYEHKEK